MSEGREEGLTCNRGAMGGRRLTELARSGGEKGHGRVA